VATSQLSTSDYVHLHNHTQYSLLDGLTRVPDLIDFVKDQGMEAVAMTDHGTLSGTIEFYKEAHAKGIRPLIGIETYVAARRHTDKDPQKDKNRFHLILLAMNHKGYQNLMQLSTTANLQGFYYYPRIDHELLEKYNEGIIALSACTNKRERLPSGTNRFLATAITSKYRTTDTPRTRCIVQSNSLLTSKCSSWAKSSILRLR
jgi:DNA polymerase III alpha subunit